MVKTSGSATEQQTLSFFMPEERRQQQILQLATVSDPAELKSLIFPFANFLSQTYGSQHVKASRIGFIFIMTKMNNSQLKLFHLYTRNWKNN